MNAIKAVAIPPIPGSLSNREAVIAVAAEAAANAAQSRCWFPHEVWKDIHEQVEECLLLSIPMSERQRSEAEG